MRIEEAVRANIDTLSHPLFGGNGRIKLHLIKRQDGSMAHGPWVTVHDDATDAGVLDPPKIFVGELPTDGLYEPYKADTEVTTAASERPNTTTEADKNAPAAQLEGSDGK